MPGTIRFYLDENVSPVIAKQLRLRGIEVFTTQELDTLGEDDLTHLQRATRMGCVFCSHDVDLLRLSAQGIPHTGIVFGHQERTEIGA